MERSKWDERERRKEERDEGEREESQKCKEMWKVEKAQRKNLFKTRHKCLLMGKY